MQRKRESRGKMTAVSLGWEACSPQARNAGVRGNGESEKVPLKVQPLTCPRQELCESQNSRRGQGFLNSCLGAKVRSLVWSTGERVSLGREQRLRTRKGSGYPHGEHSPARRTAQQKQRRLFSRHSPSGSQSKGRPRMVTE